MDDLPPYPFSNLMQPPISEPDWNALQRFRRAEEEQHMEWRAVMKGPFWFVFCTCKRSSVFVPGEPVFAECQVHGAFSINHKGEIV